MPVINLELMDNVYDIATLRKISVAKKELQRKITSLEKSINEVTQIQIIKTSYLNKLQLFKHYDSINKQCHTIQAEIKELSLNVGSKMAILNRLRKELE